MSGKKNTLYITVILSGILLIGCSTEKNTLITRSYHNLTSRYNVFFNGFESFKKGEKKAFEQFEDDYTRILPVFTFGSERVAQNISPDMDRAIQKATKVITLHSIKAKPEFKNGPQSEKQKAFYAKNEYNIYVDNNYLMMAKAYLYKHDYELAEETFKFVLTEYFYEGIIPETQIWLARLYNEQKEYREAENLLNSLTAVNDMRKKLKADLYATLADFYIKQGKYENAIEPLTKAYEYVGDKKTRIRYAFILGQLHQEAGSPEQAYAFYEKVIKMNPPYKMSFTARVNRASVYNPESGSLKEITSELFKMLKDEKNKEFRDQIYFALANIYFREKNVDEAIKYYRLSSASSISNVQQKTTTCLKLADIYYNLQQYKLAAAYYDSAVINLTADYPGYQDIMVKSKSLSGLVENLNVIQFEDSVQRLAVMDENERVAIIDTIIARLREEELLAKEKERDQMNDQQFNRMMLSESDRPGGFGQTSQGGKWYFYNQAAKSFGQPEFRMKWGNRKLEDNWRRANKTEVSFGEQKAAAEDSIIQEVTEKKILDNKTREFYLQDIPLNDSLMELSNQKLMTAYFNSGVIYKSDLKDYNKSNAQFKQLIEKYPESEYTLSAYYNLYLNYGLLNNQQLAQNYKDTIIRDFPESQIAQLMTNPGYIKELEEKESEETHFYERVYDKYKNGLYQEVIAGVDTALKRYSNSPLVPKYKFMKVMSVGATSDLMTFTLALDSLSKVYQNDEVGKSARSLLAFIKEYNPEVKEETEKIEAEVIFNYDTSAVHLFGMIIPKTIDINQLKFEIINFNLDFYPQISLDVVNEPVNKSDMMVLVKSFASIDSAWSYHQKISQFQEINKLVEGTEFQQFIISDANARALIKDKTTSKYMVFYNKYYLRKEQ